MSNERVHIPLTEAQIIAAEKGELQLETRNGKKVVQIVWLRPPYVQNRDCLSAVCENGCHYLYKKTGMWALSSESEYDLFVSEPKEQTAQKPIYEVGEIIDHDTPSGWADVEYREYRNDQVCVWSNGVYKSILSNNVRKKQPEPTVIIEGKSMTKKEALIYISNL